MKKSLKKRNLENKITIFFQKPPQFGEHSNEPFQNQHTIHHLMKCLLFNGQKSLQNYLSKTKQYEN